MLKTFRNKKSIEEENEKPDFINRIKEYSEARAKANQLLDNPKNFQKIIKRKDDFIDIITLIQEESDEQFQKLAPQLIELLLLDQQNFQYIIQTSYDLINITKKFPHYRNLILKQLLNNPIYLRSLIQNNSDLREITYQFPNKSHKIFKLILSDPNDFRALITSAAELINTTPPSSKRASNALIRLALKHHKIYFNFLIDSCKSLALVIERFPAYTNKISETVFEKEKKPNFLTIDFANLPNTIPPYYTNPLFDQILGDPYNQKAIRSDFTIQSIVEKFPHQASRVIRIFCFREHRSKNFHLLAGCFPENKAQISVNKKLLGQLLNEERYFTFLFSDIYQVDVAVQSFPQYRELLSDQILQSEERFQRLITNINELSVPIKWLKEGHRFLDKILNNEKYFKKLVNNSYELIRMGDLAPAAASQFAEKFVLYDLEIINLKHLKIISKMSANFGKTFLQMVLLNPNKFKQFIPNEDVFQDQIKEPPHLRLFNRWRTYEQTLDDLTAYDKLINKCVKNLIYIQNRYLTKHQFFRPSPDMGYFQFIVLRIMKMDFDPALCDEASFERIIKDRFQKLNVSLKDFKLKSLLDTKGTEAVENTQNTENTLDSISDHVSNSFNF